MSRSSSVLMVLASFAILPWGTKGDNLSRLPGAILLTGYRLVITKPGYTLSLSEGSDARIGRPSMSLNGEVVAAYRSDDSVSTYSVASEKWTDYRIASDAGGAIALSPDGSRLAVAVHEDSRDSRRLYLIDLKTGREPLARTWVNVTWALSWLGPQTNQACMIHPDGTGFKVLATRSGNKFFDLFMEAAVWSPDSKTILLNKLHDADKFTFDIYLLDLATLKMAKKFRAAPPVYGWAAAK